MIRLLLAAALLFTDFTSAQKKFDEIENDRCRPGSRVFISAGELTAYGRAQAMVLAPKAIHGLQVTLGTNSITASANVDFLALNRARGGQSNWLMDRLFEGEKPVSVTATVQTHGGQARVDVQSVRAAGAVVDGAALRFLIERYVLPQFPDAKVAKWFPLQHRIDHLEGRPAGVTVAIAR